MIRHAGCIGAQLVVVSNAGDERSSLLNEQRELGRRAAIERDDSRVWFEWAAPDDADALDEDVWASTIPTLAQADGIGLEFLRIEAETMRADDFRREYLCIHTQHAAANVIDTAVWASLPRDRLSPGAPIVLAVDAAPDHTSASVVAAGSLSELVVAVEVVEQRSGADWVAAHVAELVDRHQVIEVVVDLFGPLGHIVGQLERAGVPVRPVRVADLTNAAAGFVDLVNTRRIAHMGDRRLDDAVAAVGRRKIGDRWAFSRTGGADISALVAASLAVWAVEAAGVFEAPRIF